MKKFFKIFSRLNTDQKNKKQKDPKKTKRNKTIIYSVLTLASVGTVVGLTVGLTSNSTISQPKLSQDTVVASIFLPDGKKTSFTVAQVEESSKNFFNERNGLYANSKREMLLDLYSKEAEASDLFQQAWDSSLKSGETAKTFRLDTVDELRGKLAKRLEETKRKFQVTFGVNNWETEFNKELASDKYGKSSSESSAIEYLLLKEIQMAAFASFRLTTSSSFTKFDIEQRKPKTDITKTVNGEKVVVYPKDVRIFKDIIETVNTTKDSTLINGFYESNDKVSDTTPVAFVKTESFIKEKNSIDPIVNKYFAQINSLYNVSQISLNLTASPADKKNSYPSINKNTLIKLLQYKVSEIKQTKTGFNSNVTNNLTIFSKFTGINSVSEEKLSLEKEIVQSLNSDATDTQKDNPQAQAPKTPTSFVKPLRNLYDIYQNESVVYSNSFLDNSFKPVDKPNLFSELFESLRTEIFGDSKDEFLPDASTLSNKDLNEIVKLNENITKFINNLSDESVITKTSDSLKKVFGFSANNPQQSTVYKIADNIFVILENDKLVLLNKSIIADVPAYKEFIKSQLILKSKKLNNSKLEDPIDFIDTFNNIATEDFIFASLIKEESFQTLILDKLYKSKTEEEKSNFINSLKEIGNRTVLSYVVDQSVKSYKNVSNYLKDTIDNKTNADYEFNEAINKYIIKGSTSGQSAEVELFNKILAGGKRG